MQSGRSCGATTRTDKSRRTADSALVDSGRTAVAHCVRRHARRLDGNRELALQALRAEVSALRAQLVESLVREAQARALAGTDSLTRLSNRGAFLDQLSQTLSSDDPQSRRVAILFIDMDGFKAVNDLYGHRIGDELLRVVGERLSACVRATDVVARLGGDEFACLVRHCGARERVAQVAGKVFDALREPYQFGALRLHVQASIGVATSPDDGTDAIVLLDRADASMYQAKRRGSGCEFFLSNRARTSTSAGTAETA
ncbi:MAG: GGDEF domain-containing protein [Burkholderiaceae bacterium]|nr:GGDEF domain-containing protein [Burkholderiaceae bacterium]